MLSELLLQQDREDLVLILKCIAYGLHFDKTLSTDELCFLRDLSSSLNLNDYEKEQIYTLDIRYKIDINSLLKCLSPQAFKVLLFTSEVAVKVLESKSLRVFSEDVVTPLLPFDEDIKKEISKTVPIYIKSISNIYDFIWETERKWIFSKNNLPGIIPAKKLFIINSAIPQLDGKEKNAFYKILIYLMLANDEIDHDEQKILNYLSSRVGLNTSILKNIDCCRELSINTINSIHTDSVKRLVIVSYLYSKNNKLENIQRQRLSTILRNFNISDNDFEEINININNYKSIYNVVLKSVLSNKISNMNNEKASEYAHLGLSAIGTAMTFIPIIGPTLSVIDKISSTADDKRSSGLMEFGLTDVYKDIDSETIVICVDGFMSELINEQFKDWQSSINQLKINVWTKGFKWPSGTSVSFLKTGGSVWFEAVKNTTRAGERLANDIDAIYGLRPETHIVLMGHSLGARVILNTLIKMHEMKCRVHQIYLFGGAVSTHDKAQWLTALDAVEDKAYNFYSLNDDILKKLYKNTMFGDNPAGLGLIEHSTIKEFTPAELVNIDVSHIIQGHTEYKDKIPLLFKEANIEFNSSISA